jgi:hypothetical protein
MAIPKGDLAWIVGLVALVIIINLLQPTNVASSEVMAGPGTDPFDETDYTPDALAFLGGALG